MSNIKIIFISEKYIINFVPILLKYYCLYFSLLCLNLFNSLIMYIKTLLVMVEKIVFVFNKKIGWK